MSDTREQHTAVLAALAEPMRQRILELVSERGQSTASALATTLPVSRQAIVKHLRILEDAGLVTSTHRGRSVEFTITGEQTLATAEWLVRTAAEWAARTERLRAMTDDS